MPVAFKNYYATLGVARDASDDEIKKAFRKLARLYHPDVAKDKKTAEAKFQEINEANEVLSDPVKRKKYDELGANWQSEGQPSASPGAAGTDPRGRGAQEFHFGGTGFSDFFEQFFSGGSRYGFAEQDEGFSHAQGVGRPRRGGDIEGDILVTLDEAMRGTTRSISLQTTDARTGAATTHAFKVRIPPGASDGRRIRVPEQGEAGLGGGPAGDLYLRVRHVAHPDFSTKGADLYHELDVAPWEAALGVEIVVPTLDGAIKLKLPAGTENSRSLRVRGRGLPKDKTGARGDFYVIVAVQIPTSLTDAERAQWEKLRDVSSFQPRKPNSSTP